MGWGFFHPNDMRQTIRETASNFSVVTELTTGLIEGHLRVTYTDESSYLTQLANVALESLERETNMNFRQFSIAANMDTFAREFTLPYEAALIGTPVVQYTNKSGTLETVPSDKVFLNDVGAPTVINIDKDWSPRSLTKKDPVVMKVTATVRAHTLNATAKQAILLFMAHMYENREAVSAGKVVETPLAFKYLCSQIRKTTIRPVFNPSTVVR